MGQPKGNPYMKVDAYTGGQQSLLNSILQMAQPMLNQAAQGYQQFLPGGGGGQPIIDAATNRYQQQTIPTILASLGSGNKGSSALNQALASSAANLNTDLGAQLAQMQLQASQGLGALGQGGAQMGLGAQPFHLMQKQQPYWQTLLGMGVNGLASGLAGRLGAR